MSTAGEIIYKAFAPTLKIVICIGIGYAITKKGMFPPAGAKGVSILSLNVGLPALIFSSMVTAFNDDNIAAFGSLVPVAILYQCLGALMALFISEVFYVPNDFKWGILVAGATSNWGNLPIAVVQTMAAGEPFNGTTDVQLGVAYISIFVFIMNTSFFPLGIHKLCALDFREENLAKAAPLPFRARWADRMKRLRGLFRSKSKKEDEDMKEKRSSGQESSSEQDNSTAVSDREGTGGYEEHKISEDQGESGEEIAELKKRVQKYGGGSVPYRKTSRASSFTSMLETTRPIPSTAPLDAPDASASCGIAGPSFAISPPPHTSPTLNPATTDPSRALSPGSANANASNTLIPMCSNHGQAYTFHQPLTPVPSIHKPTVFQRVKGILKNFLMPVTMAICIALPCSLVLPLKALFIQVDGWTGTKMPNAPDARPPLSFILDTAEFIGGISIPAALILLGAGFARIKPPSNWRELPIGAIIALTTAKMILLPVFGIFFVQALRDKTSLYPPPDKMRTFVAILLSGTPTSVNQLVVTQLYNPAGTAHTLAMFLMVQYALMPILSTAIAALALYVAE